MFARKTLAELNAEKPLEDVYFDYDKADLSAEARASLQKNAEWLKRWPSTKVFVEGHCDARGTTEYNLALGEKRAAAVRDYLTGLGIAADRVLIVSKGEESPFCAEEAEACCAQNRRGALHHLGEVDARGARIVSCRLRASASAAARGSGAAMIGRPTTM